MVIWYAFLAGESRLPNTHISPLSYKRAALTSSYLLLFHYSLHLKTSKPIFQRSENI
jgi:hypothetical protein